MKIPRHSGYDHPMPSRDAILAVLRTIPDPELPISIVDLGLVEGVRVESSPLPQGEGLGVGASAFSTGADIKTSPQLPSPQPSPAHGRDRGSQVTIDLLPTFIGCPALEMIAGDVRAKLGQLPGIHDVKVNWLHAPRWSVERITPAGRESLKAHGVTVPAHGSHLNVPGHHPGNVQLHTSAIPCPFCGSSSTFLDSPFGPTRCRMIYYCESCRNSFEHMKRVANP